MSLKALETVEVDRPRALAMSFKVEGSNIITNVITNELDQFVRSLQDSVKI